MNYLWQLLWFIVAVGLLVTIHEFGHFWVARKLGFKVLRFSVGFGKPLLKKVGKGPDRTEYVLAAIPLGGYVKMLGENDDEFTPAEEHRAFSRKPPWQRILVLLAGPAANIVFAIAVLWAMMWYSGLTYVKPLIGDIRSGSPAAVAGLRSGDEILSIGTAPVVDQRDVVLGLLDAISSGGEAQLTIRAQDGRTRDVRLSVADEAERRRLTEPGQLLSGLGLAFWRPPIPAVIGSVSPGSAAAAAGLRIGDRIVAMDGERLENFDRLRDLVSARPGADVAIRYERDGAEQSARVTIGSVQADGKQIGLLGISPQSTGKMPDSMIKRVPLSALAALGSATEEAWRMTALQARFFARMLVGEVSLKNLSGPVTIGQFAGASASQGVAPFLSFLVLISLSLGFLNLLPIPILDGGQVVYQAIEWAKGGPLSERAQAFGQQVGIGLLVLLMGLALFNDFSRALFGG
ncbi:MAG: RIP metalloprotease RseP [Pseudomonadales bacterium]|nr:RIP metalloprotease RseP [Pseudomonadales bacterium]